MDRKQLGVLYKTLSKNKELIRKVMCIRRDMMQVYNQVSVIAEQEGIEFTKEDFIEAIKEIQFDDRCK